jgi:pimeloyl-ACP methyl ester carboxylesterase
MAWIDRDGAVRLRYDVHGQGPGGVLMTHGFSASGAMWDANVGALANGRRVVTWDMRGHGSSGAPADPEAYGRDVSLGDMEAVLDAAGLEHAVLVGMSLGGYLSLAFRLRAPSRVAGLVLVDTGPGYRRDAERAAWNAYAEGVAADLEARGLEALPASPERAAPEHGIAGLAGTARRVMAQRDASVIESLEGVDVPTLVVIGERDEPFLRAADYMAARIPGARKLVIEGAGHAANVDRPEVFNAAVAEFLEAL